MVKKYYCYPILTQKYLLYICKFMLLHVYQYYSLYILLVAKYFKGEALHFTLHFLVHFWNKGTCIFICIMFHKLCNSPCLRGKDFEAILQLRGLKSTRDKWLGSVQS